jgi:hypothetical protein
MSFGFLVDPSFSLTLPETYRVGEVFWEGSELIDKLREP